LNWNHLPSATFAERYQLDMRRYKNPNTPRVFAIDGKDSTCYVLVVNGTAVAEADWPHPLYDMRPDALSGGTLGTHGRLLPGTAGELAEDLLAVVDEWVREPRFSPDPL